MWDLEDAELHVSIATNTPRIDRSTPKSLECALPLRTHWTRLRRKGYIVLRYTRDHVMREWPMIETTILGLVQAGKHLTGAQLRAS